MSGKKIVSEFISKWHQAVKTRDPNVHKMFAKESSFVSPVVHTPATDPQYIRQIFNLYFVFTVDVCVTE